MQLKSEQTHGTVRIFTGKAAAGRIKVTLKPQEPLGEARLLLTVEGKESTLAPC
jgi:hypothetical protein